ncbi:DUF2225 domain-containing protein [Natronincola ferrireducens]|uniref:DUF2225 domain-containing protein n=1 Tax=Natronincola ferrireducens TaxID=393762 RepID=A0A1G9E030_9FIRM|nr:DUF2225 domain-containing protein [Natronincola ferrireducens]SDK69464.1 hypothetical protein SAMN05660472_01791 [Natronincola ferrireducens]
MEHLLYDKNISCPCCNNTFTTKKVRTRGLKVIERHSDFYVSYKEVNPIYYHVWICPNCGFSATESEYVELSKVQKDVLQKNIMAKWKQRDYGDVRTVEEAKEAYKLALFIGQLLKKSRGYIGGLCLKLAWLYRETGEVEEIEFLKFALSSFETAYQSEPLPIAGLDEVSLAYLVGELNRKLHKPQEAVKWYAKALDNPDIKKKRQIQLMAREQWQVARQEGRVEKEVKANA